MVSPPLDFESSASASSATPAVQVSCTNAKSVGGPEGSRTPDLYNAIVAFSQLNYRPNQDEMFSHLNQNPTFFKLNLLSPHCLG